MALIGPNGAGKTVLMSCILGDKKPSNGQVLIDGKAGKAKNKIAVLLQENTIPNSLKVEELIAFFQSISDNPLTNQEVQELLQFKEDQYQQFADKLSGGQRRLLAFVLCLIDKPKILFLDEPTAGMDTSSEIPRHTLCDTKRRRSRSLFQVALLALFMDCQISMKSLKRGMSSAS